MSDRVFTIICSIISFLLSFIGTIIISKMKQTKDIKRDRYFNFYYPFYVLWDNIHQGRAFNFYDLERNQQEEIVMFLIEHSPYANENLSNEIYVLKCSRHENFYNNNDGDIKSANEAYNKILDIMITTEAKERGKYIIPKS